MADCDNLFKEFNNRIRLSNDKKDNLRTSRNSLRKKLKQKFSDNGHEVKFHWQGSFAMNTIITPKDDNYDIDDGIYMLVDEQPNEKTSTFHDWVVDAAKNHTGQEPEDRGPCVRVKFKEGYHIDLVTYYKTENDHPYLAHKTSGWMISDPKEFMEWFNKKTDKDGQLKRLVRYFKAWGDNLRGEMPKGLVFTILAAENVVLGARDDVAFLETMKKVNNTLKSWFSCFRPTTPREDLLANYSTTRKEYFLERLASFIKSGEQAMEETNQKDACLKWKKHFGDRFPCDLAEDELAEAKKFDSSAFIQSDARSA